MGRTALHSEWRQKLTEVHRSSTIFGRVLRIDEDAQWASAAQRLRSGGPPVEGRALGHSLQ